MNRHFDAGLRSLKERLSGAAVAEEDARRLTEDLAKILAASLLLRHAPAAVSDAYCATRLAGLGGDTYGTVPNPDVAGILARVGLNHEDARH